MAVDPHKASWTAVVVTSEVASAGSVRAEASQPAGYPSVATLCRGLDRRSLGE